MALEINIDEAARILGSTTARIRQLAGSQRIKARKFSERAWAIDLASLKRYAASKSPCGRKGVGTR